MDALPIQHALNANGSGLNVEEFLDVTDYKRVTAEQLNEVLKEAEEAEGVDASKRRIPLRICKRQLISWTVSWRSPLTDGSFDYLATARAWIRC